MLMNQTSYQGILARLSSMEEWLESFGIERGRGRLSQISRNIKLLESALSTDTLDEILKRKDSDELVWSLVEGQEFADIYSGFQDDASPALIESLRTTLKGPLHPSAETSTSNRARNTAFQLSLASRLRRQDQSIALEAPADIAWEHEGIRLIIECKRPMVKGKIRRNIDEALGQLRKRFDESASEVGLVAVSVSKIVNPGSRFLVVQHEGDLGPSLTDEILRLHGRYSPDYDNWIDLRTVGILYNLFTPAYVRDLQLLTAAQQTAVFLSSGSLAAMFPLDRGERFKATLLKGLSR
jgi:hypothetical protein